MPDVPAKAKKPADRKPKKAATHPVEVGDITIHVDSDALDDFELMEDVARMEDGEAHRAAGVLRRILGPEQFKLAMDALRNDAGRVSTEAALKLTKDVFASFSPNS